MTRCGHFIVCYTSHCRRYQITNPPESPDEEPDEKQTVPEPPEDPCPELFNVAKNRSKPVSVVSIEDSCASCQPRVNQARITRHHLNMTDRVRRRIYEFQNQGDRLAIAAHRDNLLQLERCTRKQSTMVDWSIIPAPEPVFPPSWTVEDDQGLSAAWIGCCLVWDDQESLQKELELYKKALEKQRKEEEERQREQEKKKKKNWDENNLVLVGANNNVEPPSAGSSIIDFASSEEFVYGDQDRPSGTDPRSAQLHRHHPQLRKQKGREVLGEVEFFSFSNLDEDDGREDSYHIDNQNDDDSEDIWLRIASEQPRENRTTNGYFPGHSRGNSHWTPGVARANQSKRFSTQAVRGSGKRYDLKPFIPSQHQ
ncbi:hypothetical protein PG984_008664 [Apiospora sp. TS-2023a]